MTSGVAGKLSERAEEYLGSITAASADLEQMINDILDITAIDADVLDLDLGDVDVHALLSGAVEYALIKAEDTQIALTLNCPEDIGIIRADEKRLTRSVPSVATTAALSSRTGPKVSTLQPGPVFSFCPAWRMSKAPSGLLDSKISCSPRSSISLSIVYSSDRVVERKRQPFHQSCVRASNVRPAVESKRPREVNVIMFGSFSSLS